MRPILIICSINNIMFVLGISGGAVSGKSMVAAYLARKHGFIHLYFTKDILAPILLGKHKAITRNNLVNLALDLRKEGGKDILMKMMAGHIDQDMRYVIAGI